MNTTMRHIEWLLTAHNCVVVPGFGAVLAHRQSAVVSNDGRMLQAPLRTYTFNADLRQSDGIIEQSIARAMGIDYAAAQRIVADDVTAMNAQLNSAGEVSLGRAGTVTMDTDTAAVSFLANGRDDLTPLQSWLPARITAVSALEAGQAEQQDNGAASQVSPKVMRTSPIRRFARTAAAVAVLIGIGIVASTPIVVSDTNYASTALPAITAPKAAQVPATAMPVMRLANTAAEPAAVDTAARREHQRTQASANTVKTVATVNTVKAAAQTAKPATQTAKPAAQTAKPAALRLNDSDTYCVVIASLTNMDDARKFISQASRKYSGPMQVLNQGQYYRIVAATGASHAQAQSALNRVLAPKFAGAWICTR